MAKLNVYELPVEEKIKLLSDFYNAMICVKTKDEVKLFFKDLLSFEELVMLARRIQVAALLKAGVTHDEIQKTLKVSKDKIMSVQKAMIRGGKGYELVIKRLNDLYKKRLKRIKRRRPAPWGTLSYLKQKYPLHFLLFNIFDELEDFLSDEK